jgi:hypothetical protein
MFHGLKAVAFPVASRCEAEVGLVDGGAPDFPTSANIGQIWGARPAAEAATLSELMFHGLKAVAFPVASRCEAEVRLVDGGHQTFPHLPTPGR